MAQKRLLHELVQYEINSESFPEIKSLKPIDDDIFEWRATILARNESPFYHGGQWDLTISIPSTYPMQPPKAKFVLSIIHPNVHSMSGEICLNILDSGLWSPAWNLRHIVAAITSILDEPEPDLPLNVDAANMFREDKRAFASTVQYFMWKNGNIIDIKSTSGAKSNA